MMQWGSTMRRVLAVTLFAAAAGGMPGAASAQDTKIKFQLDWRFEGPSALFLLTKAKGYFAQEKLDVEIDAGSGSGAPGGPSVCVYYLGAAPMISGLTCMRGGGGSGGGGGRSGTLGDAPNGATGLSEDVRAGM